jgi:hypothetical protein
MWLYDLTATATWIPAIALCLALYVYVRFRLVKAVRESTPSPALIPDTSDTELSSYFTMHGSCLSVRRFAEREEDWAA